MNSSMRLGVKISTYFASIVTACLSMPHGCTSPTGQGKINKREVQLAELLFCTLFWLTLFWLTLLWLTLLWLTLSQAQLSLWPSSRHWQGPDSRRVAKSCSSVLRARHATYGFSSWLRIFSTPIGTVASSAIP